MSEPMFKIVEIDRWTGAESDLLNNDDNPWHLHDTFTRDQADAAVTYRKANTGTRWDWRIEEVPADSCEGQDGTEDESGWTEEDEEAGNCTVEHPCPVRYAQGHGHCEHTR